MRRAEQIQINIIHYSSNCYEGPGGSYQIANYLLKHIGYGWRFLGDVKIGNCWNVMDSTLERKDTKPLS